LYRLRGKFKAEGNKLYDAAVKLLLNSLYGKFGQTRELWEPIEEPESVPDGFSEIYDAERHRTLVIRKLFGVAQIHRNDAEAPESFAAVSAHVTAFARMRLWALMLRAGLGNVFYVDTDSLIVNASGYAALRRQVNPLRLGALKVEYITRRLELLSLKDYSADTETRRKGIRRGSVQVTDDTWRCEHWPKLRTVLQDGFTMTYRTFPVVKTLARGYDKGEVLPNGRVIPFYLAIPEFPRLVDALGRAELPSEALPRFSRGSLNFRADSAESASP
jgi:hypothetical protein